MRVILTILVCLLQIACLGQENTCGKLSASDSLYLRHQHEERAFNTHLKTDWGRTDTIATKDSMVIRFTLKRGKLLKEIVYRLDSTGCRDFVRYKYYNDLEQLVYTKRHRLPCPEKRVTKNGGPHFYAIHYERFGYDAMGRLIFYIDTWADRPYKVQYQYHEDGTVKRTAMKIAAEDFWD